MSAPIRPIFNFNFQSTSQKYVRIFKVNYAIKDFFNLLEIEYTSNIRYPGYPDIEYLVITNRVIRIYFTLWQNDWINNNQNTSFRNYVNINVF